MKKEAKRVNKDSYTISIGGVVKYKNLTESEYFDIMDDLAIEFYQSGHPRPSDIKTIIKGDYYGS
mgnify:CR=1 FL=1